MLKRRPVFDIQELAPLLAVRNKALHEGSIAVGTGVGAACIWIGTEVAYRQPGGCHDLPYADLSYHSIMHTAIIQERPSALKSRPELIMIDKNGKSHRKNSRARSFLFFLLKGDICQHHQLKC